MRTCFVSIPFGVKQDVTGRALDFEYLYATVIRPAVESVGIECRRLDELVAGAIWHKGLFEALVSSDVLIADITTGNPNVFYELGIRHALRRGRTILIWGGGPIPGNLSYARAIRYDPDASGQLTGVAADVFRNILQDSVREAGRTTINDSPIYEFFPDLNVELPPELERAPSKRIRKAATRNPFADVAVRSPARAKSELEASEAVVRGSADVDPTEFLNLLRRYRDLSDWDRLIALADETPPSAHTAESRQLLALALNRRNRTGDRDRAIELMEQHVAQTGGDSETFGILGRIYKDRYDEAVADGNSDDAKAHLDRAIHAYRDGFMKNPADLYSGINVIDLLRQRSDAASRDEIAKILPTLRAITNERLQTERPDFWNVATALQLAVFAEDWVAAREHAERAARVATDPWMLETTMQDLRKLRVTVADPAPLDGLLERLQSIREGSGVAGA